MPIDAFDYDALPGRILFGPGRIAEIGAEVERLGCGRALVLSGPRLRDDAKAVAKSLGRRAAGLFGGAVMHTPVSVTAEAMAVVRETGADCTVAIGGGSTIGLGKAIAVRTGLPQIAVPTTYSGSEVTPIAGETEAGAKKTQRTLEALPETVIYDVDLTLGLPSDMTAASGMNAIAHAVEALYAKDRSPIVSMMAEQAIASLASALPELAARPHDRDARTLALYGAWLCGVCLGAVGMALHHKLCHVLGGAFDLPHAETHAVLLPHAAAYNASAAPQAMASVARALGAPNAAKGLYSLSQSLGTARALKDFAMPADGIDRAADMAMAKPYWNPRPLDRGAIRALLAAAHAGAPPAID